MEINLRNLDVIIRDFPKFRENLRNQVRDFHPLLHELSNYVKNADKIGSDAARSKIFNPSDIYKHYVMKD